jgi:uncharacterized protein
MKKKVMVLGASNKSGRFSFLAMHLLRDHGYEVVAIGRRPDNTGVIEIRDSIPEYGDLYAVTMYLRPEHQLEYMDTLVRLKPEKVIFNPGTENSIMSGILKKNGIKVIEGCTLVMLESGVF